MSTKCTKMCECRVDRHHKSTWLIQVVTAGYVIPVGPSFPRASRQRKRGAVVRGGARVPRDVIVPNVGETSEPQLVVLVQGPGRNRCDLACVRQTVWVLPVAH
jgi:hypothetical protein